VIFLAHALPDFFDKHFRRRAIKDEETARDGRRAKARKLSRPSMVARAAVTRLLLKIFFMIFIKN
jgi:hypothetical protein